MNDFLPMMKKKLHRALQPFHWVNGFYSINHRSMYLFALDVSVLRKCSSYLKRILIAAFNWKFLSSVYVDRDSQWLGYYVVANICVVCVFSSVSFSFMRTMALTTGPKRKTANIFHWIMQLKPIDLLINFRLCASVFAVFSVNCTATFLPAQITSNTDWALNCLLAKNDSARRTNIS